MTIETARELWGAEVVDCALAEPDPESVTAELAAEVSRQADPPGALSGSTPWPSRLRWQRAARSHGRQCGLAST